MRALMLILTIALGVEASAQDSVFEEREFADAVQEQRFRALTNELRCLVCQNQAISDSNAGLAAQLRDEVYSMLIAGASDEEIVEFMVSRYGDFVLFRPPLRGHTWVLWFGPFVLLALAFGYLFHQIRRRGTSPDGDDGEEHPPGHLAEPEPRLEERTDA